MALCILRTVGAAPPHLDVLLLWGGSLWVHGSLLFFALGLCSLFSIVCHCLSNAWGAQFLSKWFSYAIICFLRGFRCPVSQISFSCLLAFGCWRALGHPSGLHLACKAMKSQTNGGNGANMIHLFAFWLGEQEGVPRHSSAISLTA